MPRCGSSPTARRGTCVAARQAPALVTAGRGVAVAVSRAVRTETAPRPAGANAAPDETPTPVKRTHGQLTTASRRRRAAGAAEPRLSLAHGAPVACYSRHGGAKPRRHGARRNKPDARVLRIVRAGSSGAS
jgi:hypothetical protein